MMELLAPIKDKENAFLAINQKVGAIYCSGPKYSARQSAGISYDDLKEIIEYAHLYDVRVYITLNTLIFDDIISDIINYVDKLVTYNIDALIIQDLGLASLVRKRYPELELHASTQMHVHNLSGVAFCEGLGFKRIVVPRELTIDQVKRIKQTFPNLELETFIHGALCTSYSGQCYYSVFYQTGSGNLGTCQQNCRKIHSINKQNNEHLLSLKDLSVKENVLLLKDVSDSLKIEGRLKGSEYLYSTIRYYQAILNNAYDEEMADLMQIAFNREYTKGRLFDKNGKELSNPVRINNHGLLIGEAIKIDEKYLTINLTKQLNRLDTIRIVNNNEEVGLTVEKLLVNNVEEESALKGKVKVLHKGTCLKGKVYLVKTRRYEQLLKNEKKLYLNKNVIKAELTVNYNEPIIIKINDRFYESSFVVEQAKKQGMSLSELEKQLNKTGNSAFYFDFNSTGQDNLFIPKSLINEYKRTILDDLYSQKVKRKKINPENIITVETTKPEFKEYCYMIRSIEQAKALKDSLIKKVYVDNLMILKDIKDWFEIVIPVLPRVIKDDYYDSIVTLVKDYSHVMVSELGMLQQFKNDKIIEVNYSLNCTNRYTLELLRDNNVSNVIMSLEEKAVYSIADMDTSELVYGYIPLMIMDYCPINENKENNCGDCKLCQLQQHYLYDDKKRKLPLLYRGYDLLELYSHQPLNKISNKNSNYSFISFTIENYKETIKVIKTITDEII